MAQVIYYKDLPALAEFLAKKHLVMAPIKKMHHPTYDSVSFKEYQAGDLLALPYGTSILPPKEYVLPPKETLFHFIGEELKTPELNPTVLFGISCEDLEGLNKLDILMEHPVLDEPYQNRRKKIIIVGLDHFTPPKSGYDLYLMWLDSEKLAGFALTKTGKEILASKLFKNQAIKIPKTNRAKDQLLNHPKLGLAVKNSKNHPVWDRLAKECFGCGICSYVCPLCYCFEVTDETPTLGKNQGSRCRSWDSCLLKEFAQTSGHNFRPELKDRIYNWYFHKFVRMPKEHGFNGCVGCNRCSIYCPAKINFRLVLKEILDDYLKKERLNEKPRLSAQKS